MEAPAQLRKPIVWLSILYFAFVVYGSLVPLNYSPRSLDDAFATFAKIPFLQLGIESRADWVANVLLFVPLAFLVAQLTTATRGTVARILGYLAIAAACGALAVTIEFVQLFFPPRTVSQNDIAAESIGAIAGIAIHAFAGSRLIEWLADVWRAELARSRIAHLLYAYAAGLVAFSVLPLDLTLSVAEIYHKWTGHRLQLTPFGNVAATAESLYGLMTDIVVWIPVGALLHLSTLSMRASIVKAAVLAAVIELFQLFVVSRTSDVTDILLAALGAWLGTLLADTGERTLRLPSARMTSILMACWVLTIIGLYWYPFDFRFGEGQSVPHRVLFETYYYASEYKAINELLRRLATFFPGGLLLAIWLHRVRSGSTVRPALLVFGTLAALIEIGQIYLPGKVPDITDWLLETLGGMSGTIVGTWVIFSLGVVVAPTSPPGMVVSDIQRHRAPVTTEQLPPPRRSSTMLIEPLLVFGLGALLFSAARLPAVPYNFRELLPATGAGMAAALLLAVAIFWLQNSHVVFSAWASRQNGRGLLIPLWLLAHAAVMTVLIRLSVPIESLHDVVGSPVLGWPEGIEDFLRFMALDVALGLSILGATCIVQFVVRKRSLSLVLFWALSALVLLPGLHWIIVVQAATDNLTELMRNNGNTLSFVLLGLAALALHFSAAMIGASLWDDRKRGSRLMLGALALPATYLFLNLGLESTIIKYGRIFSAMQFLLSADRDRYSTGADLAIRYAVSHAALVLAIAGIQASAWRRTLQQHRR